jgi:hypothetical protein
MKCRIINVWKIMEEVMRISKEKKKWLEYKEKILKEMERRRGKM